MEAELRQILGPQLGSIPAGIPMKVTRALHRTNAGEFHNSVPAQLSTQSQLGCLPLFYLLQRVVTVPPLKIVSVETGVPGVKPPQGLSKNNFIDGFLSSEIYAALMADRFLYMPRDKQIWKHGIRTCSSFCVLHKSSDAISELSSVPFTKIQTY